MDALANTQNDPISQLVSNGKNALSYVNRDVAIRRPLDEIVEATLDVASKSVHTKRSYSLSIALFLAYLEDQRGDLVPVEFRPIVQKWVNNVSLPVTADTGRKSVSFDYGITPAGVLRLVDQSLIDGFSAWRLVQGDKPNTATIRIYAIRTFLAVALRENVLTPDQAQNMGLEPYKARQRRDIKPVGRRLSKSEVKALRNAPDISTPKGKRDLCILDFALFLGLREAEIAGLNMANFQQDNGRWWLILTGKGNKTRKLKLHDQVYKSLTEWCNEADLSWHEDKPVFYSVDRWDNVSDKQINPTDVSRTIAAMGSNAGISTPKGKGRLGAHDLRRTCARNAYDNGAPLLLVQKMLGHSDPKTTASYIGLNENDTATAIDFVNY